MLPARERFAQPEICPVKSTVSVTGLASDNFEGRIGFGKILPGEKELAAQQFGVEREITGGMDFIQRSSRRFIMALPELCGSERIPCRWNECAPWIFFNQLRIPGFGGGKFTTPTVCFTNPKDDFVRTLVRPFRQR